MKKTNIKEKKYITSGEWITISKRYNIITIHRDKGIVYRFTIPSKPFPRDLIRFILSRYVLNWPDYKYQSSDLRHYVDDTTNSFIDYFKNTKIRTV